MKVKIWRQSITIVALVLLLASSVAGCAAESPERRAVNSYLDNTEAIINDASDIALEVSSLYKTAQQSDPSEVVRKCTIYGKKYDDLFASFMALQCPPECSKLREYLIDGISYSKQEVTQFGAYFETGDTEYLYKAESYYNDAQRSIALAAGEWDRLKNY